jgi:hypothetical protein
MSGWVFFALCFISAIHVSTVGPGRLCQSDSR